MVSELYIFVPTYISICVSIYVPHMWIHKWMHFSIFLNYVVHDWWRIIYVRQETIFFFKTLHTANCQDHLLACREVIVGSPGRMLKPVLILQRCNNLLNISWEVVVLNCKVYILMCSILYTENNSFKSFYRIACFNVSIRLWGCFITTTWMLISVVEWSLHKHCMLLSV